MQLFMGRREFLEISLALVASSNGTAPNVHFPTNPRERLAVSSYPFREFIANPARAHSESSKAGMTLEQFGETVVQKFDVPGIEPWSPHFESIEPDYVRSLSSSFQRSGLRVVNIPVDESVHLCSAVAGERDSGMVTLRRWVDAAVILGSPSIRVHLPRGNGPDDLRCATDMMKDLANYGASKDIVINLENDEPDSENPDRVLKVIEAANTPYLRSLPDFCNSMLINGQSEYNYRALQRLFPHAYNISHVKDQESENGKIYRVDVNQIFAIAKKADYRGYFSMEWEGSRDPYEGTKGLIEASLRNLT
ncbi:MAG: sugar phosphate isomerase/epimerase [Acidobacteriaceae bacterium]|nr:sugar phosphate isomerase/epimerase [Acidobacteriaceae bacterium]